MNRFLLKVDRALVYPAEIRDAKSIVNLVELAELCGLDRATVRRATPGAVPSSKLTGRRARTLAELDSLVKNAKLVSSPPQVADSFVASSQLALELVQFFRAVLAVRAGPSVLASPLVGGGRALPALPAMAVWKREAALCVARAFQRLSTAHTRALTSAAEAHVLQSFAALYVLTGTVEALRPGCRVSLVHRGGEGTVTAYCDGASSAHVLVDGDTRVVEVAVDGMVPMAAIPPPPEGLLVKIATFDSKKETYEAQCDDVIATLVSYLVSDVPLTAMLTSA